MADNLEIASAVIEKVAIERCAADLDDGLAGAYQVRRRHREVRPLVGCHNIGSM
jgi:CCR4-NOT transcription complex subunit 1